MSNEKKQWAGRPVEQPTIKQESGPHEGTVSTHPAYAMVGASRVSGGAILFGSDFLHQGYVRLRITGAELHRSLSNDWPLVSSRPIIEVDMSEAQWAAFVSSMNVGNGVQCTLREANGKQTPALPDPEPRSAQFSDEATAQMDSARDCLKELEQLIASSGLSKTKQVELLRKTNAVKSEIGSNQKFVADQFDEHMERTTEHAKIEINAYAVNLIQRAGLQALAGDKPVIEMITGKPSREVLEG